MRERENTTTNKLKLWLHPNVERQKPKRQKKLQECAQVESFHDGGDRTVHKLDLLKPKKAFST